ncbi:type I-G CRISPR-associated protein Csb2 [Nocardia thailandica]
MNVANGIRARFLLGTYVGHRANGIPDPIPSMSRLHAALLNAAGQGSTAIETPRGLMPSDAAIAALQWLERNPPTGLCVPRTARLTWEPKRAFRKEGLLTKEAGSWKDKVTARPISEGIAVSGEIGWCWDVEIPDMVLATLDALCNDVGCLGETTSPVVLEVGDVEPTHFLDPDATPFDAGGLAIDTPTEGRTSILQQAHRSATERSPSAAQDRHSSSESAVGLPVPQVGTEVSRYREPQAPPGSAPWPRVLLVPAMSAGHGDISPQQRVAWCVTMHRALISVIGLGASPLITGRFPAGAPLPPNRVAIQYLSPSLMSRHHNIDTGAFAVMLPAGSDFELSSLMSEIPYLSVLTRREGRIELGEAVACSGADFWSPPAPGSVRLWRTDTVIVPETAPQRRGRGPRGTRPAWTLHDAAKVSIGLVWRDEFAAPNGNRWFELLADQVSDHHVRVFEAKRIHTTDVSNWVHRTPSHIVVQPFRATLSLGDLAGSRSLVALGQSRHLGAGLLVPRDVAVESFLESVQKGER